LIAKANVNEMAAKQEAQRLRLQMQNLEQENQRKLQIALQQTENAEHEKRIALQQAEDAKQQVKTAQQELVDGRDGEERRIVLAMKYAEDVVRDEERKRQRGALLEMEMALGEADSERSTTTDMPSSQDVGTPPDAENILSTATVEGTAGILSEKLKLIRQRIDTSGTKEHSSDDEGWETPEEEDGAVTPHNAELGAEAMVLDGAVVPASPNSPPIVVVVTQSSPVAGTDIYTPLAPRPVTVAATTLPLPVVPQPAALALSAPVAALLPSAARLAAVSSGQPTTPMAGSLSLPDTSNLPTAASGLSLPVQNTGSANVPLRAEMKLKGKKGVFGDKWRTVVCQYYPGSGEFTCKDEKKIDICHFGECIIKDMPNREGKHKYRFDVVYASNPPIELAAIGEDIKQKWIVAMNPTKVIRSIFDTQETVAGQAAGMVQGAAGVLEAVPILGATLNALASVLKAKHIGVKTIIKCKEVKVFLEALQESLDTDSTQNLKQRFRKSLELKTRELELVITEIVKRSKATSMASSFEESDLEKIDVLLKEIRLFRQEESHEKLDRAALERKEIKEELSGNADQAALEQKELSGKADELKLMVATVMNQLQSQEDGDTATMGAYLEEIDLDDTLKQAKELLDQDIFVKAYELAMEVLESDVGNYAANLISALALYGSAKNALKESDFKKAIEYLNGVLEDPPSQMPNQRVKHARTYRAFAQYAFAKQCMAKHDYHMAVVLFEETSNARELPVEQQKKCKKFLRLCNSKIDALAEYSDDDGGGDEMLSLDEWREKYAVTSEKAPIADILKLKLFMEVSLDKFVNLGLDNILGLADLEDTEIKMLTSTSKGIKKRKIKRCIDELRSATKSGPFFELIKTGRAFLFDGNLGQARNKLREARKCDRLPKRAKAMVNRLLDQITDDESLDIGSSSLLDSVSQTLDLDTNLVDITRYYDCIGENVHAKSSSAIAYLQHDFPTDEGAKTRFVSQLQNDCAQALGINQDSVNVLKLDGGSVVATLLFEGEASIVSKYYAQVQDPNSKLYHGEVTRTIDAERTMGMSTQLADDSHAETTEVPREYNFGQRVVIWEQGDEKVECEVHSLLGIGAFGKVYEVEYAGKKSALKVFRAATKFTTLCDEATIALQLSYPFKHENVLPMEFVCVKEDTKQLFFLVDLVEAGDLKSWIANDDDRLYRGTRGQVEQRLLKISYQISLGVAFLVSGGRNRYHLHRVFTFLPFVAFTRNFASRLEARKHIDAKQWLSCRV
jgi:hypothetical protein